MQLPTLREQAVAWLGAERAKQLEERCPGAFDAGLRQASGAPVEQQPALAAIRALQVAGFKPRPDDLAALKAGTSPVEIAAKRAEEAAAAKEKADKIAAAEAEIKEGTHVLETEAAGAGPAEPEPHAA